MKTTIELNNDDIIAALKAHFGASNVAFTVHPAQYDGPGRRSPATVTATVTTTHGIPQEDGRPDFAGFVEALRTEAHGTSLIHRTDKTGQAFTDQDALNRLADTVEQVGERLGFLTISR